MLQLPYKLKILFQRIPPKQSLATHSALFRTSFQCISLLLFQWTVSTMTSENKNGGYSWGTLYGRPMERLAFHYGRHKEATRYALKSYRYYHTTVMHVFCLPLRNFGWFRFSRCHRLQFNAQNMFHEISIQIF